MKSKHRKLKKITVFDVVVVILLILICLIFLYPIWNIIVASFSDPLEFSKNPLALFPKKISLFNFNMLISNAYIWNGYKNTLIYVVVGTIISVVMTFVMAYGLSLKELPYKRTIGFLVTLTLFFSGGMIPTFLIVKAYKLTDTMWSLVLPGAIGTYNLMVTRTYLSQQIPEELKEAAEVDGAGPFTTFIMVVTPLAKPIIAVIALFYASTIWNAWYDAMIYLKDNAKWPLQLILRNMLINDEMMGLQASEASQNTDVFYTITLNYSIIFIALLPLFIIFPFVQKFFTKGVMIGAIKG